MFLEPVRHYEGTVDQIVSALFRPPTFRVYRHGDRGHARRGRAPRHSGGANVSSGGGQPLPTGEIRQDVRGSVSFMQGDRHCNLL
jgi:hypothetical protein